MQHIFKNTPQKNQHETVNFNVLS